MKARRDTVAAVAAAVVLLAGGGAAAAGIVHAIPDSGSTLPGHRSHPVSGRVTGGFQREGGPLGPGGTQPPIVPLSGVMQFARAGHRPVIVPVGKTGMFSVQLSPGVYRVFGRTPDIVGEPGNTDTVCSLPGGVTVTATAGMTRHVTVVCAVP